MSAPVRSGQNQRRHVPAAGWYEPLLTKGGRTIVETREAFVGIDVAKLRNAVAVADAGRDGEVRFYGERWTRRRKACAAWRRSWRASTSGCTSVTRPARPATGCTGCSPASATPASWSRR